jgi:heterodisulfide reductase subunit A
MEVLMDVVILSIGMEPSDGTIAMAEIFNLPLECHGWIETVGGALNTVQTPVDGVFVAGAAAGPADLEDSISMGGAAALKACAFVRRIQLPVVG